MPVTLPLLLSAKYSLTHALTHSLSILFSFSLISLDMICGGPSWAFVCREGDFLNGLGGKQTLTVYSGLQISYTSIDKYRCESVCVCVFHFINGWVSLLRAQVSGERVCIWVQGISLWEDVWLYLAFWAKQEHTLFPTFLLIVFCFCFLMMVEFFY